MTLPPTIVLLTVNANETHAVIDAFVAQGHEPPQRTIGGITYNLLGTHGGMSVVHTVCEMGAGGLGASQDRTSDAARHWTPAAIIAVGIAFGVDETKQGIGDVLVATQVQDYELARVNEGGRITPRGDKPATSDVLRNRLRMTDMNRARAGDSWPKVRFGLLLSGQKLVDDLDYRDSLKALHAEAIGGEMEAVGLYVSAHKAKVDWIVVKAICDWGHRKVGADTEAWQRLAAANAARVLKAALDAGNLYAGDGASTNRGLLPRADTGVDSPASSDLSSQPRDNRPIAAIAPRVPRSTSSETSSPGGAASERPAIAHPNALKVSSRVIPYIPLFHSFRRGAVEYRWNEVRVEPAPAPFKLPPDLATMPLPAAFQRRLNQGDDLNEIPKCRFIGYQTDFRPQGFPDRLLVHLCETSYADYLRSGENLDHPSTESSKRTFRDKYAADVAPAHDFGDLMLTNICGVGLFVITADRKLIVSQHSRDVAVFPDVLSYSASGTMDWNRAGRALAEAGTNDEWVASLSPFAQIAREACEEIGYEVSREELRLIGLGIDVQRLYFQFSFVEQSAQTASELMTEAHSAPDYHREMERLIALPFDLDRIVALIQSRRWEPAAEAMLLVLCAHEFGIDRLERAIDPVFVRRRWEERMRAEWKRRAERPRELAVMSTRYPAGRTGEESQRFVDAQLAFIDRDVTGKDVVEIGCGTGRLTTHLVSTAGRLTCIDLSEAMLARNRETVGEAAKRIRYVNSFGQDYGRETRHDVALCSMVFVHNVDDVEFSRLAQALANAADVLFLFEHVDAPDTPHEHTRIRSEDELLAAFRGFGVSRRREYALFQDRVLFLKLIRERQEG